MKQLKYICIAMMLYIPFIGNAQLLVMPSGANLDKFWYNSYYPSPSCLLGGNITGINVDMIDMNGTNTTLLVSDFYGNETPGGIVFTDESSGFTLQFNYLGCPMPYYMTRPDIIVGNDSTYPGTDFNVAAAYIDQSTGTPTPQIDYYKVHYTGPGIFSVSYINSTIITGVGIPNWIHLNVIAEAANTTATGYPWCDKFIVTWDDISTPTGAIYAWYTRLNSPDAIIPEPAAQLISAKGMQPDVAAIQRLVAPCAICPPVVDDMGLFVFTDIPGGTLFYVEWDVATGAVTTPIVPFLDNQLPSPFWLDFDMPRIEAPDNYTINNPLTMLPGQAYFKVAVQNNTGVAICQANTYDNAWNNGFGGLGPGKNTTFMPPSNQFSPTVAWGANGTQYPVAYNSNYAPPGYPTWNTFMGPIDWMAGNVFVTPPNNYYLVNLTPFGPTNAAMPGYLVATCTPCNNPGSHTLVAWSLYDMVLGYSTVHYKTTPYPYAFKPGRHNTGNAAIKDWNIFPNPAANTLTIDNPLSGAARYEVKDMLGRTVLNGQAPAGSQAIDVSKLASGSYFISTYDGETRSYNAAFVKQ
jgi:Secretion system C-terminal sorting domain